MRFVDIMERPIVTYVIMVFLSLVAAYFCFRLGGSLAEVSGNQQTSLGITFKAGGAFGGFVLVLWMSPRVLASLQRGSMKHLPTLFVERLEDMPALSGSSRRGFDISRIEWEDEECFILGEDLREKVRLVRSPGGRGFEVHFPKTAAGKMTGENYYSQGYLELNLKDKKGNRWEVKPFRPSWRPLQLSAMGPLEKIIRDYDGTH